MRYSSSVFSFSLLDVNFALSLHFYYTTSSTNSTNSKPEACCDWATNRICSNVLKSDIIVQTTRTDLHQHDEFKGWEVGERDIRA
jgi:hypothetical protein